MTKYESQTKPRVWVSRAENHSPCSESPSKYSIHLAESCPAEPFGNPSAPCIHSLQSTHPPAAAHLLASALQEIDVIHLMGVRSLSRSRRLYIPLGRAWRCLGTKAEDVLCLTISRFGQLCGLLNVGPRCSTGPWGTYAGNYQWTVGKQNCKQQKQIIQWFYIKVLATQASS